MAEHLSIGEVARRAGLRPSALRFYEEAGLLRPAARVGGRRRYESSVLRRLSVILLLRDAGFSIREMRALLRTGTRRNAWRPFAERKLLEIDAQIAEAHKTRRLIERALACNCGTLEGCAAFRERLGAHR
ncbi:MAG: MerR family transcriptional regulator [Actinomycetota bacterium]